MSDEFIASLDRSRQEGRGGASADEGPVLLVHPMVPFEELREEKTLLTRAMNLFATRVGPNPGNVALRLCADSPGYGASANSRVQMSFK